jgi:hypothetical protein
MRLNCSIANSPASRVSPRVLVFGPRHTYPAYDVHFQLRHHCKAVRAIFRDANAGSLLISRWEWEWEWESEMGQAGAAWRCKASAYASRERERGSSTFHTP